MPYNCNQNSVCPVIAITAEFAKTLETHRGKAGHADSRWVSLFTGLSKRTSYHMKLRSRQGARNVSPLPDVAPDRTLTISRCHLNDRLDFPKLVSAVSRTFTVPHPTKLVWNKSMLSFEGRGNLDLPAPLPELPIL